MSDVIQVNNKISKDAPLIVQIEQAFQNDEALKGLLCFNETFQTIQFTRDFKYMKANQEMEDSHEDELMMHLTKILKKDVPRQKFTVACNVEAMKIIKNPIKDYLNGIEWDGNKRCHQWLSKFAHTPSSDYHSAIGKIVLTAAVARVFHPGIKYDYMLILEGRTRIGKSRLLQALGGEYYLDMHLEDTNKDIIDNMRGKWIIEISELAGFGKREVEWLKAFLSRGVDRVRLSYGRRSKDYPRQSILIGSMNPSGDNTYFRDDTGNARYWPVVCGDTLDVEGLKKERDQLFGEALFMYKSGMAKLYLEGEAFKLAEKEQMARLTEDPWTYEIAKMVLANSRWTTADILHKLGVSSHSQNIGEQMRVGKIMKQLGWERRKDQYGAYYSRDKQEQQLFTGDNRYEAGQMASSNYQSR